MEYWLTQVINGASFAMLLFLVAVGLSLVLGLMGYLNLAHGAFVAFGGYVGLSVYRATDSFPLAIAVGALASMVLGVTLQRVLLHRFRTHLTQVLGTFGLVLIIMDGALIIWGGVPEILRLPDALRVTVSVGGATTTFYRLLLIVLGVLVFLAMWWFQQRTRYGAVVRAGLDDPAMVELLGINLRLISTIVFALGVLLAGAAGVLGGPLIGLNPSVGFDILLLALVVIVIGGLGSIEGTFLAALVVGLTDNLGRALFPHLAYFTLFAPMAVLLIARPGGLFARR